MTTLSIPTLELESTTSKVAKQCQNSVLSNILHWDTHPPILEHLSDKEFYLWKPEIRTFQAGALLTHCSNKHSSIYCKKNEKWMQVFRKRNNKWQSCACRTKDSICSFCIKHLVSFSCGPLMSMLDFTQTKMSMLEKQVTCSYWKYYQRTGLNKSLIQNCRQLWRPHRPKQTKTSH